MQQPSLHPLIASHPNVFVHCSGSKSHEFYSSLPIQRNDQQLFQDMHANIKALPHWNTHPLYRTQGVDWEKVVNSIAADTRRNKKLFEVARGGFIQNDRPVSYHCYMYDRIYGNRSHVKAEIVIPETTFDLYESRLDMVCTALRALDAIIPVGMVLLYPSQFHDSKFMSLPEFVACV